MRLGDPSRTPQFAIPWASASSAAAEGFIAGPPATEAKFSMEGSKFRPRGYRVLTNRRGSGVDCARLVYLLHVALDNQVVCNPVGEVIGDRRPDANRRDLARNEARTARS